MTQTADVPLVDSSLVTDRDSERITIYGQYKRGGAVGGATCSDTDTPESFLFGPVRYCKNRITQTKREGQTNRHTHTHTHTHRQTWLQVDECGDRQVVVISFMCDSTQRSKTCLA